MKQLFGGVMLLFILILAGCGLQDIDEIVSQKYTFVDVITSSSHHSDVSRVYRADDESIDQVVNYLTEQKEPQEISTKVDDKQSLIYDDHFVILTKDDENNTLIEVATYGFVRENYRPSFFQGMYTYMLLDRMLDTRNWKTKQANRCQESTSGECYGGYNTVGGGYYRGPTAPPISRGGSTRGGGPGTGK
ncbi:DUF4247 domain-containing protein [Caldalkalibacillus salinus]|uniref:DUF4247 domain-containing protein n=1 Tax=Caldalkalibacillus salinus TaxID=2803787 RepID=UPI001921D256|nr:DUF4247 domain-containing protein [Caldalkalibacillus salinus]